MITFIYKNHRGEVAERRVIPMSLDYYPKPNNEYGYGPGWFLTCADYTGERTGQIRSFALTHIQLPEELFAKIDFKPCLRLALGGPNAVSG